MCQSSSTAFNCSQLAAWSKNSNSAEDIQQMWEQPTLIIYNQGNCAARAEAVKLPMAAQKASANVS